MTRPSPSVWTPHASLPPVPGLSGPGQPGICGECMHHRACKARSQSPFALPHTPHPCRPCLVSEYCVRGSLFDVLQEARRSPVMAAQLDWPRRLRLVRARGLEWRRSAQLLYLCYAPRCRSDQQPGSPRLVLPALACLLTHCPAPRFAGTQHGPGDAVPPHQEATHGALLGRGLQRWAGQHQQPALCALMCPGQAWPRQACQQVMSPRTLPWPRLRRCTAISSRPICSSTRPGWSR